MLDTPPKRIDMHFHAVVLGGAGFEKWGRISKKIRESIPFRIILKYARIGGRPEDVTDQMIENAIIDVINKSSEIDHIVCLALDPVYDRITGKKDLNLTSLWVDNEYILHLRGKVNNPKKVLFGASVHPYDGRFKDRVKEYVEKGAVLLKWLPSSQLINLADSEVRRALEFLATAGPKGGPLPLLLHVGPEGAIPPTDPKAYSNDYLQWRWRDRFWNRLRKEEERLYTPRIAKVNANLQAGLDAGATIIFAHCGLPYFAPKFLKFFEHSDFKPVRKYLEQNKVGFAGKSYADVSAVVTPFRQSYFRDIRKLPEKYVLAGSDWPVPVFELSAGPKEHAKDLAAILRGDIGRIVIPQGNLLNVNWKELKDKDAFGKDHPMFSNAQDVLPLP